jgi:RNA-directed DNA polymerase
VNTKQQQTGQPTPPEVPEKATRSGSSRGLQWGTLRLSHDSAHVWTERMLAALERGNDGRQWHTLIDKVFSPKTLGLAFASVTGKDRGAGIDGITTKAMREREAEEVTTIARLLQEDRYAPSPVRRVWIDKPGSRDKRPLGIPTVRDRIVQQALRATIEPIFEQSFSDKSYGFRPGRSAQAAVARVEEQLRMGKTWVVDADIKGYFDNIPQDKLLTLVQTKVSDRRVIELIGKFLRQGVMESLKEWEPTMTGTPQGAVISPLLANIYLDPLDQQMAQRGHEMIRYADDFIILCQSEGEAKQALAEVTEWMSEAGLTLHPEKTKVVDATQKGGFEFLGWHFERGYKWPREKSIQKFKDSVRSKTKRTNGSDMRTIIKGVNQITRGWGGYFCGGVKNVPERLEQWTRMRLRSILRKRDKRKGRGHGRDHNRYPNAWFAERGMIFLTWITHRPAASPAK